MLPIHPDLAPFLYISQSVCCPFQSTDTCHHPVHPSPKITLAFLCFFGLFSLFMDITPIYEFIFVIPLIVSFLLLYNFATPDIHLDIQLILFTAHVSNFLTIYMTLPSIIPSVLLPINSCHLSINAPLHLVPCVHPHPWPTSTHVSSLSDSVQPQGFTQYLPNITTV